MSTLLEQASLVLIPSGYKEDTVYSVIPSNGSGDMSFTRASNGTRINSDGLVENTPWNLVTYSEDFSNGAWVKQNSITVTANTTTAPNGTLTADTLEKASGSGGTSYYYIVNSTNSFEQLTNFFYVKYKSGSGIVWLLGKNSSSFAFYDVINGTALSATSGMTTSIENVGNGWYKCIFSQTYVGAANTTFGVGLCLVNGTPSYDATTAPTQSAYIWGSQSNIGSTAKPYFPTTDRLNVPRLTYQNGGGGCPSLLMEKQSTNIVLNSEDFSNASWGKSQCSITANNTTSPDGTQNADKLIEDANTSIHEVYSNTPFSLTSGVAYTKTIYAKSGERTQISLNFVTGGFGQGATVIADLNAGTLGTVNNVGGVTGSTATIINVGNGWYRISLKMTPVSTANFYADFSPALNGVINYAGNGTSGIYIWGAQIEASSYATSYISTTSSSATRIADACSKTGIGSLFGSSYTLSGQFINQGINNTRLLSVKIPSGGSYDNFITIFQSGTGLTATGNDNISVAQFTIASGSYTVGQTLKFALRCQANNVAFYINGTQIGTDVIATIPAVTAIFVGNYTDIIERSLVNQVVVFNSALTNSELATLTTI